jgi:hypothetical protein
MHGPIYSHLLECRDPPRVCVDNPKPDTQGWRDVAERLATFEHSQFVLGFH